MTQKTAPKGTVILGGCTWTIRHMTRAEEKKYSTLYAEDDDEPSDVFGLTDPDAKAILIKKGMKPDQVNKVLIHELFHAITSEYAYIPAVCEVCVDEAAIHSLSNEFHSVLKQLNIMKT